MNTMQEQLFNLGLVDSVPEHPKNCINQKHLKKSATKKRKNKSKYKKRNSHKMQGTSLNRSIHNYLIKIITQKLSFDNLICALKNKRLILSKHELKSLFDFYCNAIKTDYLDDILLRNKINKIDYIGAEARFNANKINNRRKNNRQHIDTSKANKTKQRNISNKTASEIISQYKASRTIGLGIKSSISIPKVKRDEVKIDKHTLNKKVVDKSILYVAGWASDNENNW